MRPFWVRTPSPAQNRIVVAVHQSERILLLLVEHVVVSLLDHYWGAAGECCKATREEQRRRREDVGELLMVGAGTFQSATDTMRRTSRWCPWW